MTKIPLIGKTVEELKTTVSELNMPSFTGQQIADWLYKKRAFSIDEMTNISIRNRDVLKKHFEVGRKEPQNLQTSVDGTKKMLFETMTGQFIESVTIPEDDRLTLCVSSQVGCKMNCSFA